MSVFTLGRGRGFPRSESLHPVPVWSDPLRTPSERDTRGPTETKDGVPRLYHLVGQVSVSVCCSVGMPREPLAPRAETEGNRRRCRSRGPPYSKRVYPLGPEPEGRDGADPMEVSVTLKCLWESDTLGPRKGPATPLRRLPFPTGGIDPGPLSLIFRFGGAGRPTLSTDYSPSDEPPTPL